MKWLLNIFIVIPIGFPGTLYAQQSPGALRVLFRQQPGVFVLAAPGRSTIITIDAREAAVVKTVATYFCKDIQAVTGILPLVKEGTGRQDSKTCRVIAGTLGQSSYIDSLVKKGQLSVERVAGKWEAFSISLINRGVKNASPLLVIAGSDSRGTAFGLFELSRMMGVHPFYWWADIPIPQHPAIYIAPGGSIVQSSSVKYRGIFLNDEDWGLQPWAAGNLDTAIHDIGPATYEKIFELLLRLKANYIWPAMHPCTKAFWYYPENPAMARKYGIVVGASHCEPMLRNNVFEWVKNFVAEYGMPPGEWRYDHNREQIHRYWEDRVQQSTANEAVYTVGMRGIHDGDMPGPDSFGAKVKLLEQVIADQQQMLEQHLGKPAAAIPQIFCPYKEVLDIYRSGMALPGNITIAWSDDNHGYIRQLPDAQERKRPGGNGVYYHLSYWGAPRDYLWLSSISPSLIAYEMHKAYTMGADRLWVFNVGDLKPAELETQFALDLAWNIDAWKPGKAADYPAQWAADIFGPALAGTIGRIKSEYYRLAATGKPEHLNELVFTPEAAEQRLKDYQAIAKAAHELFAQIPEARKDAYFQLVYYPVAGACLMNEKILYARKSLELAAAGNEEALQYADRAKGAYDSIQQLTTQYNTVLSNGKWKGMMNAHPRGQQVFNMPRVANASMIRKPASAQQVSYPQSRRPTEIAGNAFINKQAAAKQGIQVIPGLGINGAGVTPAHPPAQYFTEKNISLAPYLEYRIERDTGDFLIQVNCLPAFPAGTDRQLRYGISVGGESPVLVNIATEADSKEWGRNVLRGYAQGETSHRIKNAGPTTVRIYLPDPGLVLNIIIVQ